MFIKKLTPRLDSLTYKAAIKTPQFFWKKIILSLTCSEPKMQAYVIKKNKTNLSSLFIVSL